MSEYSLEIHFFGFLKKKIDSTASMAEDTVQKYEFLENETLFDLIQRLGLKFEECGDCFINGKVVESDTIIPRPKNKNTRIAIFSTGMHLLCGGQHLKGHGYITKNIKKKVEYYK